MWAQVKFCFDIGCKWLLKCWFKGPFWCSRYTLLTIFQSSQPARRYPLLTIAPSEKSDRSPPKAGSVLITQRDVFILSIVWSGFVDAESQIVEYELAVTASALKLPTCGDLIAVDAGCKMCKKSLYEGRYLYCTNDSGNLKVNCGWVGGPGDCTFAPEQSVSLHQCKNRCLDDINCKYFSSNDEGVCYLHLVAACATEVQAGGMNLYHRPCPEEHTVLHPTRVESNIQRFVLNKGPHISDGDDVCVLIRAYNGQGHSVAAQSCTTYDGTPPVMVGFSNGRGISAQQTRVQTSGKAIAVHWTQLHDSFGEVASATWVRIDSYNY